MAKEKQPTKRVEVVSPTTGRNITVKRKPAITPGRHTVRDKELEEKATSYAVTAAEVGASMYLGYLLKRPVTVTVPTKIPTSVSEAAQIMRGARTGLTGTTTKRKVVKRETVSGTRIPQEQTGKQAAEEVAKSYFATQARQFSKSFKDLLTPKQRALSSEAQQANKNYPGLYNRKGK